MQKIKTSLILTTLTMSHCRPVRKEKLSRRAILTLFFYIGSIGLILGQTNRHGTIRLKDIGARNLRR